MIGQVIAIDADKRWCLIEFEDGVVGQGFVKLKLQGNPAPEGEAFPFECGETVHLISEREIPDRPGGEE